MWAGGSYCCLGCRLADKVAKEAEGSEGNTSSRLTFAGLLALLVMMLALFLHAEDVYLASPGDALAGVHGLYRQLSGALSGLVLLLVGPELLLSLWASIKGRRLALDSLVVIGGLAAYAVSWRGLLSGGPIYFDSAAGGVTLVTAGRWLEASYRRQAGRALAGFLGGEQERVRANATGRCLLEVAPALLQSGMVIWLEAGAMLPVDGEVLCDGEVSLGVASGEARVVAVERGEALPAGAKVVGLGLCLRVLRGSGDSKLFALADLSENLRRGRGTLLGLADDFARALVPVVVSVVVGVSMYWSQAEGLARAVDVALSVLLVACPCTYGVVVPLVFWIALRQARQEGVFVRSGEALERLAKVEALAFDKTGTLTRPLKELSVRYHCNESVSGLVAALEHGNSHPIAKTLYEAFAGSEATRLCWRRTVDGGVVAEDDTGRRVVLGSAKLMRRHQVEVGGGATAYLARPPELLAEFGLREELLPASRSCFSQLRDLGVGCLILSGDRSEPVSAVAHELGVEGRAELSPRGKVEELRGHQVKGVIGAVGDGLNDGPLMAASGVAIAVEGATDLAKSHADVVLLNGDLESVPRSISFARRTVALAHKSLMGVTLYNAVFLLLAAAGWLRPVWAGLAMLCASLISLASATRVGALRPDKLGRTVWTV
jgi:P-type E1-E2 ATPase